MGTYPDATVLQRSGKNGWYVCVTVPQDLRPFFKTSQRWKKIRGAKTKADAYDKRKQFESEIYLEFDRADLANHPLVQAAKKLEEAIQHKTFDGFEENPLSNLGWMPEDLFDNDLRWQVEDDIRSRASISLDWGAIDPTDIVDQAKHEEIVQPLYDEFVAEFRNVSQASYAPKKRGKLFSEVAEEYHASDLFRRNKKTQELKRQKSLNKEITSVDLFKRWAGAALTIDEFGYKLATDYSEALADRSSGLIDFRGKAPSNETIQNKFSAIKNVLDWAIRNEYIQPPNPWTDVSVDVGEARVSYRDWTEEELQRVFSLDMPQEDFLCLAILACTGARLDEIALLEWDQFDRGITKGGEWVHWLDTTDAIVKNKSSRRLIPILPKVAELIKDHPRGLNKKEPDRLFAWTKDADGKAENKASRALMKHLRKVSTDDSFAVHGLRHTVTSMLRVEQMDWEMREFMLGRGGKGEGANYGKAAHVEAYLDKMRDLDISFLDGQKVITKQITL